MLSNKIFLAPSPNRHLWFSYTDRQKPLLPQLTILTPLNSVTILNHSSVDRFLPLPIKLSPSFSPLSLSCPLDRSFPPLSTIVCSPINYPRRFFFALGARTRWKIFPTTAAPGIWESWQTGKRFRTRVFQVLGCDFRLLFAPKRRRVCKLRTLSFSFRAGVCLSSRPSSEPDFTSCAGSWDFRRYVARDHLQRFDFKSTASR